MVGKGVQMFCAFLILRVFDGCFLRLFVSITATIYWKLFSPSLHKFVLLTWSHDGAIWIMWDCFLWLFANYFLRYRKFFNLWNFLVNRLARFFYKEMRMRNVYIGLLLESILFILLTFVTYSVDQTIETVCLSLSWVFKLL